MLIAEAIDTLITLGWAAFWWLLFFATVASIFTLTAIATGAYTARALWRTAGRPSWARSRARARLYARRTRKHDYEEAA